MKNNIANIHEKYLQSETVSSIGPSDSSLAKTISECPLSKSFRSIYFSKQNMTDVTFLKNIHLCFWVVATSPVYLISRVSC